MWPTEKAVKHLNVHYVNFEYFYIILNGRLFNLFIAIEKRTIYNSFEINQILGIY